MIKISFFLDSLVFLFFICLILRLVSEKSQMLMAYILLHCNTCLVSLYFLFFFCSIFLFIVIKTSIKIMLKREKEKRTTSIFCSFLFLQCKKGIVFCRHIFMYSKSSKLYKCKKKGENQTSVSSCC
jgi:hypothetical protein